MKLFNTMLAIVATLMLTACGGYGDDYRAACKDGDFDAAHDILDRLHSRYDDVHSEYYGSMKWNNDGRARRGRRHAVRHRCKAYPHNRGTLYHCK